MHAASRSALERAVTHLNTVVDDSPGQVALAAQTGTELFDSVEVLDSDRALRVAVAEASTTGEQRAQLMRDVFGGKVLNSTLSVLTSAATDVWSTPRELRTGLIELGRRALLKAAHIEGTLEQVESELFQLSRILEREGKLTQLLTDRTATPDQKRQLLAGVVYGKLTATAEALALQAVGRPEQGPIEDLAALAELAASLRGKTVARVQSAAPLTAEQLGVLTEKLGRIYGSQMVIHSEVDPSILGGMIIRVGSEVIDGSTAGKLERLRAVMA